MCVKSVFDDDKTSEIITEIAFFKGDSCRSLLFLIRQHIYDFAWRKIQELCCIPISHRYECCKLCEGKGLHLSLYMWLCHSEIFNNMNTSKLVRITASTTNTSLPNDMLKYIICKTWSTIRLGITDIVIAYINKNCKYAVSLMWQWAEHWQEVQHQRNIKLKKLIFPCCVVASWNHSVVAGWKLPDII